MHISDLNIFWMAATSAGDMASQLSLLTVALLANLASVSSYQVNIGWLG